MKSVCQLAVDKSGLWKLIGQFSINGICSKISVKFVTSHLLVLVSFDLSIVRQIRLFCLRSVCQLCLCHEYIACKVQVVGAVQSSNLLAEYCKYMSAN